MSEHDVDLTAAEEAHLQRLTEAEAEGDERAVEAALRRRLARRRQRALVEAGELGGIVEDHCQLVGVGEEVLLESSGESGQPLVEVAQGVLVRVAQSGAGKGEFGLVPLDQVP